ncbi:MAG: ATP-dependent DNA helicase [Lachnospiraceae bacterium]|nr:ATP-dependent DNA helicase [Lachnospiraceae bacterium]
MQDINQVLKTYYGYASFRPGQEAVIRALLSGRDALGIMPTGAGKSVCYQIPALILPGLTLVVTPLISLMEDQVAALTRRRIPARYINSSMPKDAREEALRLAASGALRLLYVSPERLASPRFLSFAEKADVSLLVVDEAHCISGWGREFRPAYRKIADFAGRLPRRPVIAALTATATAAVKADIIENLHMRDPFTLTTGFDRPNLFFTVQHPADKWQALLCHLHRYRNCCGIVYCMTRRTVEALAKRLVFQGINCRPYHAGLPQAEREKNQADWLDGKIKLIVATNAFGMGIDKPDVRFVLHYNLPMDMENYYQEAGRAGRDGKPSECILLTNDKDLPICRFFIDHPDESEDKPRKHAFPPLLRPKKSARAAFREYQAGKLRNMQHYAAGKSCLRQMMLASFGESSPSFCGKCSVCLRLPDPGRSRSAPDPDAENAALRKELLALRKRIAKEYGIPPYRIFSDQVVRDLALVRPSGLLSLLLMENAGFLSCLRFGPLFLEEIRNYRDTH